MKNNNLLSDNYVKEKSWVVKIQQHKIDKKESCKHTRRKHTIKFRN